jgi:hypothetical protein
MIDLEVCDGQADLQLGVQAREVRKANAPGAILSQVAGEIGVKQQTLHR